MLETFVISEGAGLSGVTAVAVGEVQRKLGGVHQTSTPSGRSAPLV